MYACGGETWTEGLTIPANVSLHGGFDCTADWAYAGEEKRSILASTSTTAITWVIRGCRDQHRSDGVADRLPRRVRRRDNAGGSSIALFVREDLHVAIWRCDVVAGNGADGLDCAPAEEDQSPDGAKGNNGGDACSAPVSKGAPLPRPYASWAPRRGPAEAGPSLAADGADGEPAANPPAGQGGLGETSSPCTPGQTGKNGADGNYGLGGHDNRRLTVDGYVGVDGQDGQLGQPGQGGGGGGGTFGKPVVCGATNPGGAAGGSGVPVAAAVARVAAARPGARASALPHAPNKAWASSPRF